MDPELSALTSTAATTLVQLLATAACERATNAIGGLCRRVYPGWAETVQAELVRVNQAGRDLHVTTEE